MVGETEISGRMNVVDAVDLAIQRTRHILFEPFLYSKWLNLGVMIFLGVLGGSGTGGITSYASNIYYLRSVNFEDLYFDAETYVLNNLGTILIMVIPIFAVVAIISAALMYVGARGTIMVVRAIAVDDDDIGENWSSVDGPAWTYFVFRLELGIAMGVYTLIAGFVGLLLARQQGFGDIPNPEIIVGILVVVVVTIVVSIAYSLAMFSMRNFIAPLVYHRRTSCAEAWAELFTIVRLNPGPFVLYLVIKIIYSMVFGVVRALAGYCTCCLGFLPVISQAVLAPLHVFERAYSLYVLESLGPDYAIIQAPPLPEPPMLPSAINAPPPPDINR